MTHDVTIDQAGASTLAGRAEDLLDGASVEALPTAGACIGRYVVLDHLGTGGMGVVFAAYDPELDRKVAVKLLRLAEGGSSSSEGGGARLLDEARALARLSHPNVIAVHDVGVHNGRIFVAMEFVDGQTLAAWQRARSRGARELCRAYVAAGEGLAAAHRAGLVHRDFKPDNVMIDAEGRIRVLDFGLARSTRRGLTKSELGSLRVDDPRTRGLVGTPAYMAPEQLADGEIDARTDQFSFCVALWEALFEQRPFRGDTVTALAWSVLHEDPVVPQGSFVDPRVSAALLRGLSKDPARRFATMDVLLRELEADRGSKRTWVRLSFAAIAGGAIAVGSVAMWPEHTDRCATSGDVAEVWGDTRRQELAAALGPDATQARTIQSVEAGLDAYASALSTRLRRACEAASHEDTDPDELSRTQRCLQRRQAALGHAVALLVSSPKRTRIRGTEIVGALPPVAACDVADREDLDVGVDAESIELVDALESRLDDAELRMIAGQADEPKGIMDEALEQAREHSLFGVEARARYLQSVLHGMTGANAEARQARIDAFAGAIRAGRNGLALWAASALVHHHAFTAIDLPQADDWLRITSALADRISPNVAQQVAVANATGTLAFAKADYTAALEAYTRARELCGSLTEQRVSCVRERLDVAQTLSKLGRHEQALEELEGAIEVQVALHGETHPQTAVLVTNHSAMLAGLGRTEEALEQSRNALAVAEAFWGKENSEVIPFLGNASDALIAVGRLEEAATLLDRVVAILERDEPVDEQMMSYARYSRGMLEQARGRWRAAADDFQRSTALREGLFGASHPLVQEPRFRRADALLTAGDPQAALDELNRLMRDCPETGCESSDLLTRAARVEALAALHRGPQAEAALAELAAVRDRAPLDDPRTAARVRVAELCLQRPTGDVREEERRLKAALLEHDGPGSPAAARLEARSRGTQPDLK